MISVSKRVIVAFSTILSFWLLYTVSTLDSILRVWADLCFDFHYLLILFLSSSIEIFSFLTSSSRAWTEYSIYKLMVFSLFSTTSSSLNFPATVDPLKGFTTIRQMSRRQTKLILLFNRTVFHCQKCAMSFRIEFPIVNNSQYIWRQFDMLRIIKIRKQSLSLAEFVFRPL